MPFWPTSNTSLIVEKKKKKPMRMQQALGCVKITLLQTI